MRIFMKCLNEQKSVKRIIGDLHDEPWVDEFVVVDGWSSDYTVQELKQFQKVVVFRHKYEDWFHNQETIQADILLSYAKEGEIIFLLDFDERLNYPLKRYLSKINDTGEMPEEADLVHIPRRTIEVMRHIDSPFAILGADGFPVEHSEIGQFPDYQPRLIRKSYKMHWVQSPHRTLLGHTHNYNIPIETSCHILHYEKDDKRDRDWIERRWLRPDATRKALGLGHDLHTPTAKAEYADSANPEYWKDQL